MCAGALIFFRCRNNFYPTLSRWPGSPSGSPRGSRRSRGICETSDELGCRHSKYSNIMWNRPTSNIDTTDQAICIEASFVLVHRLPPDPVQTTQASIIRRDDIPFRTIPKTTLIVQHSQPDHRLPSGPDSTGNPASLLMASLLALTSSASFNESAAEACFARSFSASAWTVHTAHRLAPTASHLEG